MNLNNNFMSVDVDIYMNNILKFFKENQNELLNLVPKEKEQEFYIKIRKTALKNYENGIEVSLTRKQLVDICVEINEKKEKVINYRDDRIFQKFPFGTICLN